MDNEERREVAGALPLSFSLLVRAGDCVNVAPYVRLVRAARKEGEAEDTTPRTRQVWSLKIEE